MQKTIADSFSLSGPGIHSGRVALLSFSPAPPNSGISFIKKGKKIPATIDHIKETKRGTSLEGIAVVEHLLSALYALGIDNVQVEVMGDEIPILDGSSLPFVEALRSAGLFAQTQPKNTLTLDQPIKIVAGEASLEALPSRGFRVNFMVDFAGIDKQTLFFDLQKDSYKKEIAPARTFGYIEEYELLKEQGLALGANLENALVLSRDGYVNAPRFPDEIVRHKILDLIGDLALLGRPLLADIKAVKSGHALNIELVRRILEDDRARH